MPGLRAELATELIRSLPKAVRRHFAPAPEFAGRALDWLAEHPGDSTETLTGRPGRALRTLTGELVEVDEWDLDALPGHLRVRLRRPARRPCRRRAAGGGGGPGRAAARAGRAGAAAPCPPPPPDSPGPARRAGSSGPSPRSSSWTADGHQVVGYPALVDEGATVGLVVLDTRQRAQELTSRGASPAGAAQHPRPHEVGGRVT